MPKEKPPEKSGKQDFFDFILAPFQAWWGFIQTNYKIYYTQLLKIALIELVAGWVLFILFAMVGAGLFLLLTAGGGMSGLDTLDLSAFTRTAIIGMVVLGLFVLIALVITGWIQTTIGLTAILFTDMQLSNRSEPFSIRSAFQAIQGKVLKYVLLEWVLLFILILPGLLLFVLPLISGGAAGLLAPSREAAGMGALAGIFGFLAAIFLFIGYAVLVFNLYRFFAQFWKYGFLLGNLGVMEALKTSFSMVKRKWLEVIAFDLFWLFGIILFSVPLSIYGFFAQIGLRFISFGAGLAPALWIVYLVVLLVHVVIATILTTIVQVFSLPTHYLFWKKLAEE